MSYQSTYTNGNEPSNPWTGPSNYSTGSSVAATVNDNLCSGILIKYNRGNLYEDRGSSDWLRAHQNCKTALESRNDLVKVDRGQLVAAANLCIRSIHVLTDDDWSMIAKYIAQRI
jgi:hypothetical protein